MPWTVAAVYHRDNDTGGSPMDQDSMPFASAPEPYRAATPVPIPITGIGGGPGKSSRTGLVIAAAVAIVLLVAAGLTFYMLLSALPSLDPAVVSGIRERAVAEYPGFDVVRTYSRSDRASGSDSTRMVSVYVELRNRNRPGFIYTAMYEAPESVSGEPAAYENGDDFFSTAGSSQPTDSFMAMWLRGRPGKAVGYVFELGSPSDDPRMYEVGYTASQNDAGTVTSSSGTLYFAYAAASGSWEETTQAAADGIAVEPPPVVSAPPVTEPDASFESDSVTRENGSLVDTETTIARALPAFRFSETATDAMGGLLVVLRHRKYPKVRLVVDPIFLDPGDTTEEALALFNADKVRGDAFAKMWSARHPGKIIDTVYMDLDETGDTDVFDVDYVDSIEAVHDWNKVTEARFRYDRKSRSWRSLPVTDE